LSPPNHSLVPLLSSESSLNYPVSIIIIITTIGLYSHIHILQLFDWITQKHKTKLLQNISLNISQNNFFWGTCISHNRTNRIL